MHTNYGEIEIELFDDDAPQAVKNFLSLASEDFTTDDVLHRVIPDFMIQAGGPSGTARRPRLPVRGRVQRPPVRGPLAMANSGPNTKAASSSS